MPHIEKPSILVIDDEPDALCNEVALGLNNKASANVVHPHEVELSQLQNADLVLVDFRLDRWNERDAQSAISLQPATGLALAVVLREQVDQSDTDELTAFALYSAHLSDIQGRLPLATAQHVLARLNNLEWAFPKTEPRRYQQMVLLAAAVRKLPRTWPQDAHGSTAAGQSLLAIQEDGKSFERCWRDVLECRPASARVDGGRTRNPVRPMAPPSDNAISVHSVGGALGRGDSRRLRRTAIPEVTPNSSIAQHLRHADECSRVRPRRALPGRMGQGECPEHPRRSILADAPKTAA